MRTLLLFAFLALSVQHALAQLNTQLSSRLEYSQNLNDVWGYVAPDGTEYALVGTVTGVSVVSLANPAAPREVDFVPGTRSTWRDIKTFGHFAYVTTDSPNRRGLAVIDLSALPDSVRSYDWVPAFAPGDTLRNCHNLYIDEQGTAYLAGCNVNGGGIVLVDVATQAGQPAFIAYGPRVYAHDVITHQNRMFTSEIFQGNLGIYDISDKRQIQPLALQSTPFRFTHNAWPTADGRYIFTTDERANAPTAAFDLSDLDNIIPLDQYVPEETAGQGVIPHNVHVRDNYLYISHYTDGLRIVDATRPSNMIEVGNYDTSPNFQSGFHGAWGAYPFLPSGLVLVSDIERGLFVVKPNLKRAAYLEGTITAAGTREGIPQAEVRIISSGQPNKTASNNRGNYQAGLADGGTYQVTFSHPLYLPKTLTVTLVAGEVATLNVELVSVRKTSLTGQTISLMGQTPVAGAQILLTSPDFTYTTRSGATGAFSLPDIVAGVYTVDVGAWGFRHRRLNQVNIDTSGSLTITLESGYEDDFFLDLGWTTDGTATGGLWIRGLPDGIGGSAQVSPSRDIEGDLGDLCFITGNRGGNIGSDDVDDGEVWLRSPLFDLSEYQNPVVSYYTWFFNSFGNSRPNDSLNIYLSNGSQTVLLESITESRAAWRPQSVFHVRDFLEPGPNMQLLVMTADRPGSGHIVEAAFDVFRVQDDLSSDNEAIPTPDWALEAFPNPFRGSFTLRYELPEQPRGQVWLRLFNLMGQEILRQPAGDQAEGQWTLGEGLPPGAYLIRMEAPGLASKTLRVVKSE